MAEITITFYFITLIVMPFRWCFAEGCSFLRFISLISSQTSSQRRHCFSSCFTPSFSASSHYIFTACFSLPISLSFWLNGDFVAYRLHCIWLHLTLILMSLLISHMPLFFIYFIDYWYFIALAWLLPCQPADYYSHTGHSQLTTLSQPYASITPLIFMPIALPPDAPLLMPLHW